MIFNVHFIKLIAKPVASFTVPYNFDIIEVYRSSFPFECEAVVGNADMHWKRPEVIVAINADYFSLPQVVKPTNYFRGSVIFRIAEYADHGNTFKNSA